MHRLVVDGDNKVRRTLWFDSAGAMNIVRFDLKVFPFALAADSGIDGYNESGIHNHHKAEEVLADGLEPALVGLEEYSEHEADAASKRHIREPRHGDDVLPRRENHRHQHRQRQDGDGLNQRRLAPQLLPVENRVLVIIFHLQSVCFALHFAARHCEQALIALALTNGCFISAFSPRISAV